MKKLLLTAFLLGFCSMGKAFADYAVPEAQTSNPASIWYGGVKYASSVFSAQITSVTYSSITAQAFPTPTDMFPQGAYIVYGVDFSTGNCMDFVEVFDSTSTGLIHNKPQPNGARLYNVQNSTSANSTSGSITCSGFAGFKYPVRYTQGLFFRPSTANYNMIRLYYWKPE